MINLSISGYFDVMCHPKNISVSVCFLGKMSRLSLYLKITLYHLIIHILGKDQSPTSTWDLHDEYLEKNILEWSHKPQNYKQNVVYIVNGDFQVIS